MPWRMRCAFFFAGCLIAAGAMAQFPGLGQIEDRTLDDITESGWIEIAVYRDFPPYSFIDENGAAAGLDIAVGTLIAEGLGVEPRWFWITPDETLEDDLRNAVWKGSLFDDSRADVMLRVPYDIRYAHARDGYGLPKHDNVVMFGPYHRESWAIARDLEKTGSVRNLAIFRFEKVAVEIASLPDSILSGAFNGQLRDNVVHYSQAADAVGGLLAGEVAAVVAMRSQIEWGLRHTPGRFDVDNDGLQQSIAQMAWDIGAAVKQNHRQLAYAIEDVLTAAMQRGELARIFKDHGVTYTPPNLYETSE